MSNLQQVVNPSDRMAAIWTYLSFEDCVVLEYGPMGTTCYAQRQLSDMGLDSNRLLVTHLDENDVVLGDVSRLERAIRDIDADLSPRAIFIVPSAILAVTGADVKGVCHYMQADVSAQLIVYEGGGFLGDESVGLQKVYEQLVKTFVKPKTVTVDKTYHILGAYAADHHTAAVLEKVVRYMSSRGFTCSSVLGWKNSIQALSQVGNARLSIILCTEALPAAIWLETNCDIPYLDISGEEKLALLKQHLHQL